MVLECGVNLAHILGGVEAEGDSALVGDDDDSQPCAVEVGDCLRDSGKCVKLAPGSDIAALRLLPVEDSVAVQKDGVQGAG